MRFFWAFVFLGVLFSLALGESSEESSTSTTTSASSSASPIEVKKSGPRLVYPRRRLLRRKFGANFPQSGPTGENVTTSMSMSVSSSVSEPEQQPQSWQWERRVDVITKDDPPEDVPPEENQRKPWRPKKFNPFQKKFGLYSTTSTAPPTTSRITLKPFFPRTKKYNPFEKQFSLPSTTTTAPPTTSRITLKPFFPRTKKFTPFQFKKLLTTTTPAPPENEEDLITEATNSNSLFSRLRPKLIFNKRNRFVPSTTATTIAPVGNPVDKETPNSSFKPKARPHFMKPTNRPLVKTTLKKLYRPASSTTVASEAGEDVVPDLSPSSSTTPTTGQMTTTPEVESSTSTTTSTTTPAATTSVSPQQQYVSSKESEFPKSKDKDMIIIPVPPSQRKPYHPVIMQVTKTPAVSSTERPQTKIVTYKLNKMFVPLGIYGKVLPKSEINSTLNAASGSMLSSGSSPAANLVTPPPRPFKATGSPQIRHKGTSSEELVTSGDTSTDFASSIHPSIEPMSEADAIFSAQEWAPAFQRPGSSKSNSKERGTKQFASASEVDLTTNYKPDISSISLTTRRPNIDEISLTTTETPSFLTSGASSSFNYNKHNSMTHMGPPRPFDKPSPPKSMFEYIKNAAASATSSIPGLIHGGLTHLSQFAPFDDGSLLVQGSSNGQGPVVKPTKAPVTLGAPDEETLEYFRKRPHLIKPTTSNNQPGFNQPTYTSGGFKPVTAPPHFAKAYYASTTTPKPPSQSHYSPSTTTRPSSSNHDTLHKPSLLSSSSSSRNPKNVQDYPSHNKNREEHPSASVDQLLESSRKYKYSATASPFESDLIRSHWKEMNDKYTENDIQEATNNIYSLFTGPTPPTIDEMLYMRPPGHWSRTSTSAFHDLLKMFRLGFTYGATAGSASSPTPAYGSSPRPSTYFATRKPLQTLVKNTLRSSTDDGWRPIKAGSSFLKQPFVSFSAGVTIGSTAKPTPLYPGHGGSHFSSSSKPFVPGRYSNDYPSGSAHAQGKPFKTNYNSYDSDNHYNSHPPPHKASSSSSYARPSNYAPPPTYAASGSSYAGNKGSSFAGSGSSYGGKGSSFAGSGSSYGGSGSTYAGSDSSYVPSSSYDNGNSHFGDSGASYAGNGPNYAENGPSHSGGGHNYESSSSHNSGTAKYVPRPASPSYSDVYYSSNDRDKGAKGKYEGGRYEPQSQEEDSYQPPKNFASLYENDPGIEVIPSSVYYKQKEAGIINSAEIAAVLKPDTMSEEEVKAHIPESSTVPQITYPNGKAPPQLQTLSQLNEYFQTAEPTPQNHMHFQPPLYRIIQQSMQSQSEQLSGLHQQAGLLLNQPVDQQIQNLYKQQETPVNNQYTVNSPSSLGGFGLGLGSGSSSQETGIQHHHHQAPSRVQHHHHQYSPQQSYQNTQNLPYQAPSQYQQGLGQQQHHAQATPKPAAASSGLSFTDFELPPGVDPDIAALLKAELDKDDIPEEFRKEFENQEKAKQQQQQKDQGVSSSSSEVRPTVVRAPPAFGNRRQDVHKGPSAAVFHRPIPISPTLLTPVKGRLAALTAPKVPPQIPKYVIDLAKKLRHDKTLQGIVRVTSKKEGGPPIEYLYPVHG